MCHVLIIEDEALIAEYVGELVREAGASSLAYAASEREAIAAAHAERPAVILSDVKLTEGTGPRAIKAIVDSLGPIPVIFITSTPDQCETSAVVVAVLRKPFNAETVLETFRQAQP